MYLLQSLNGCWDQSITKRSFERYLYCAVDSFCIYLSDKRTASVQTYSIIDHSVGLQFYDFVSSVAYPDYFGSDAAPVGLDP
jgi:hypothetical protein